MITAIIQARMNSTRLPGKVMSRFSGNTLLGHIIERLTFSKSISKIVVATTESPSDDPIVKWVNSQGIHCFRGSESNVLNRYYQAAKFYQAQHIARITADDPFKDPRIIDQVGKLYFDRRLDFAYNNKPPSFAEGLDVEIFSFSALETAEASTSDSFEQEHVTQHFYRNPDKFRQLNLSSPIDYSHFRWTIDTPQDLEMATAVYERLYTPGKIFLARDILDLLAKHPEISRINQSVKRSDMYKK